MIAFVILWTLICIKNNFSKTYLEILGLFYFLAIYFVFNLFYSKIDISLIKRYLYIVIFLLSLTGILGVILTNFGVDTFLAWPKDAPYPYFKGIGRASGLSGHPNNLMIIITIGWILKTSEWLSDKIKPKTSDYVFFGVTGLAAILTFSKMGLLLIMGVVLVFKKISQHTSKNAIFNGILFFLIIFYLSITHYGIYDPNSKKYDELFKSGLVSDREVLTINPTYSVFENNYALTKKAAILLGLQNQPFGIGNGQFVKNYPYFKEMGYFTPHMNAFEPHSLYTGFWVENGVIGLLSLLTLFVFLWKYFKNSHTKYRNLLDSTLWACMIILFIYLVDGFVNDVFFLRYYFLIFVLATVIVRKQVLENELYTKPEVTSQS
jgi:hypothetical protein